MAHLLIHGSDEERENVSISENYRDVRVQWNPREIQAHLIEDIRTHVYLPFSEYQKTLASIIR